MQVFVRKTHIVCIFCINESSFFNFPFKFRMLKYLIRSPKTILFQFLRYSFLLWKIFDDLKNLISKKVPEVLILRGRLGYNCTNGSLSVSSQIFVFVESKFESASVSMICCFLSTDSHNIYNQLITSEKS